MGLVEDQKPVEQFAAQGADQSFADRVGSRGLCGAGDDLQAVGRDHGIKRGGELGVAISDQKTQVVQPSAQVIGQVPTGAWATHAPVGFAVTPATCSRRVPCPTKTST